MEYIPIYEKQICLSGWLGFYVYINNLHFKSLIKELFSILQS